MGRHSKDETSTRTNHHDAKHRDYRDPHRDGGYHVGGRDSSAADSDYERDSTYANEPHIR